MFFYSNISFVLYCLLQIVSFLQQNAHPRVAEKTPTVPENVTDQVYLNLFLYQYSDTRLSLVLMLTGKLKQYRNSIPVAIGLSFRNLIQTSIHRYRSDCGKLTEIEWKWHLRIFMKISHPRLAFFPFQWHNIHITYAGGSLLGQVVLSLISKWDMIQVDLTNLPKGQEITMIVWDWIFQGGFAITFLNEIEILVFFDDNLRWEPEQVCSGKRSFKVPTATVIMDRCGSVFYCFSLLYGSSWPATNRDILNPPQTLLA